MPSPPQPRQLLIPFAGRSSPACRAAIPTLKLPRLEALLGRLSLVEAEMQDDSTLSAPHERALAAALGIASPDGQIPWAAWEARRSGLASPADAAPWGLVTLCNWQVGMDDVVLGDPSSMRIDDEESTALLAAARPFFETDGLTLFASGTPGRWLARGDLFDGLPTASIDRAVGCPISQWSSLYDGARTLRRLQNEMQMLLYTERVNDARTARGVPPINSFWVSGTGRLPAGFEDAPATSPVPEVTQALRQSALDDDAAAWTAAWHALDEGVLADLVSAYSDGADVTLTLCGDRGTRRHATQQRSIVGWARGFFSRPSAASVLEGL